MGNVYDYFLLDRRSAINGHVLCVRTRKHYIHSPAVQKSF